MSPTTVWRIFCSDLGLRIYKITLTQELKYTDHKMHRIIIIISDWTLKQFDVHSELHILQNLQLSTGFMLQESSDHIFS